MASDSHILQLIRKVFVDTYLITVGRSDYTEFMSDAYRVIDFLLSNNLLNDSYTSFVREVEVRDGDSKDVINEKTSRLLGMVGAVLTHAACNAWRREGMRGLARHMLLLGHALELMMSDGDRELIAVLVGASGALTVSEELANKVLSRAGLSMTNIDKYLDFCSFMSRLYELVNVGGLD